MRADRAPAAAPRRHLAPTLTIAALALLAFANTFPNTFHLDDHYRVVGNPGITQVSPWWRHFVDPRTMSSLDRITQYRPLLPLTLSFNHALHGYDPPGYHAVNLLFHAVSAVLAYFLGLALLTFRRGPPETPAERAIALVAALVFAVHPISGITVNYVCARDLGMMETFLLASLLVYVQMRRRGETGLRWAAALALFALSLLAKTNPVVLPALIFLFEIVVAGESAKRWAPWRRAAPFAVVVAAYFLFTSRVLAFSDLDQVLASDRDAWLTYGYAQARLHLFHYARNLLWPFSVRQMPQVPQPSSLLEPAVIAGLTFIAASLLLAWRIRRAAPDAAFGIAAYWILMAPESSVFPFHHTAVDYRPYAGLPFVALALSAGLFRLASPWVARGVAAAFVLFLTGASLWLNTTWRTGERLWTHSVRYGGDQVAHLNLAMSLADRRDPRVRAHLEEALRLFPNYVLAHINLGLLLVSEGEVEKGLWHCRHAVALQPDWAQSHYWLSRACATAGRPAEAARASARAAELDPRNVQYQYQAAFDAQQAGDYAGSLRHVAAVERVAPGYANVGFVKAFALQKTGDLDGAIAAYRTWLQAAPDDAQATFNLAHALMSAGRCAEAVPAFERTLRLRPDYDEARRHLERCRTATSR